MARKLARTGAQATGLDESPDTRPSKRRRTDSTLDGARTHLSSPVKAASDVQQGIRGPRRRSEPKKSQSGNTPASTRRAPAVADGAQRSARRVSRRLQEVAAEHDAETVPEHEEDDDVDSEVLKQSDENLIDSAYGSKEDSLVEGGPTQDDLDSAPLPAKDPISLQPAHSTASLEIPETPGNEREAVQTPRSKKSSTRRIYSQQRKSSLTKRPNAPRAVADREEETDHARSSTDQRQAREDVEPTADAMVISESEDELQSAGTTPVKAPSARSRRAHTRHSDDPEPSREPTPVRASAVKNTSAAVASPRPKGILTPSKGRRNARHKSVVFDPDEQQIRAQLGFRDIDESPKKSARSTRTKETTSYAEAEDDPAVEDDSPEPTREDDPLLDFDQPLDLLQSLQHTKALPAIRSTVDSPSVSSIKQQVLSQLTSARPCPPGPHLSTQQSTLTNLLRSTIASGESNSLLMLGPRGSGKTLLLEHVLKELEEEHSSLFHVVRLNGFFQTDDRVALREIWRQLGRETQEPSSDGDESVAVTAGLSYADTLASLLSLLSHPDEMEPDLDGVDARMTDEADGTSSKVAKSTIIILDEFDLFTLHPRQTLLYNLFDIAQSRKAPIAVSPLAAYTPVRTLGEMNEVVEKALTVRAAGDKDREVASWNDHIKQSLLPSPIIAQLISQTFHTTKSVPDVLAALHTPIATLALPQTPASQGKARKSQSSGLTTKPSIINPPLPTPSTNPHHTILSRAMSLPTLHLALLAALSSPSYPSPLPSFSTTFTHYQFLLNRTKLLASSGRASLARATGPAAGMRAWSQSVCRGAWEEMIGEWGVLTLQGAGGSGMLVAVDEWAGVRVELDEEDVLWVLKHRGGEAGGGGGEMGVYAGWIRGDVV
ncbi:Origin recognition complex subunit 4 [Cyphellophora attinorum]|uniref:Origin recognition complex subunit 4 n=1 Tax=Cyphellophora attinorum TaxID=1664694 RepID=A0A0N1H993_9EURO|nr:Origin recognition complex subunit 4 [Phialophora attinorum]KPI44022.1 Origin recognition complex subunit 4 [Phialophora attinorum]